MRLRFLSCAVVCALISAAPSYGGEATLSIANQLIYESNVFKTVENGRSDAIYSIVPSVRFREEEKALTYDVKYTPTYDVYFVTQGINGFDHNFRSTAGYRFTGDDSVSANLSIVQNRINQSSLTGDPTTAPSFIGFDVGFVTRYEGAAAYEHSFTPRLQGQLTGSFEIYDYSDITRTDSRGGGADMQLTYALTAKDLVGFGGYGFYRQFDSSSVSPPSQTSIVNVNLIWDRKLLPHTTLSMRGGPAVVVGEQDGSAPLTVRRFGFSDNGDQATFFDAACVPINGEIALLACPSTSSQAIPEDQRGDTLTVGYKPGQEPGTSQSTDVTYFASVSLRQELQLGFLMASYVRRQDASNGGGSTTVRDEWEAVYTQRINQGWDFTLRLNYNIRKSASDFTNPIVGAIQGTIDTGIGSPSGMFFAEANFLIPNAISNDFQFATVWTEAQVRHYFRRNISASVRFRYIQQETSFPSSPRASLTMQDFIGWMSVRYEFDGFIY